MWRLIQTKVDPSDFEHALVVAARYSGLYIQETADILGFSASCRECSQKEYPMSSSCVDENASSDDGKATVI